MLINNKHYMNSASDRRRASIERAFSIRTKIFVVSILGVLFSFLFFEAEVIQAYIPEDSTFDTPVLRKVFDPKLTQHDQAKFRSHEILLRLSDVSEMDLLEQHHTPQNQAYQWIVNEDPLKLGIDDHNLVQRYVLALLWFSTTSHESVWRHQDLKWLSASHECNWNRNDPSGNKGVLMCTDDFQVRSLLLAENNLHGRLPSEFKQLTKLVYLDLQNNALTGELPAELGELVDLDYAGLSTNQFRGTVPASLGRLRSMEQLLLHDNQLTGQVPSTVCNLFTRGVLFNLWSDCHREGGLECECCTACCATHGKCGPREQSGPKQEFEVPNGAISAVSMEEAMMIGKLPKETNLSADQIPDVATLDQTNPTEPESPVIVVQNNPGGDEQVQRPAEHFGKSDPGPTVSMPSLPYQVSSPLSDEAKQDGGAGEIQTSAEAIQGNGPPVIKSPQEQPQTAAIDLQKEQVPPIKGRDEVGAQGEENKTSPPSMEVANRVDQIDPSMVIQGSGPPIIKAPQAQNETAPVKNQQGGTELVNGEEIQVGQASATELAADATDAGGARTEKLMHIGSDEEQVSST